MTDRDHFAAAALTGLLVRVGDELVSPDRLTESAFAWADAMLAARGPVAETTESTHVAETCRTTNHDAAPEATAADVAPSPRQSEIGTGNQQDDGPGDGWRYLKPGEVREAGDEFRSMGRGWRPVDAVGAAVGAIVYRVHPGEGRQYRRRIAAAPAARGTEREPFGLEAAMRRIEIGGNSLADAQLVTRRLRECRSKAARWCAVAADAQKAAAGVTLTDAERDLLRRLGPRVHTRSYYTVTLSADERKTVAGLLGRLGGGT